MGLSGLPPGQAQRFPDRDLRRHGCSDAMGRRHRIRHHRGKLHRARQPAVERRQALLHLWRTGRVDALQRDQRHQAGSTPITLATAVTETAGINALKQRLSEVCATPAPASRTPASSSAKSTRAASRSTCSRSSARASGPSRPMFRTTGRSRRSSPSTSACATTSSRRIPKCITPRASSVPHSANPVTGINGALQFTGNGNGTCNCSTPANNYYKNFGPRVGLAYQLDSKTVVRASYGVMFTHGDAVGGQCLKSRHAGLFGGALLLVELDHC